MANQFSRDQWQALKDLPAENVFRFLGLTMHRETADKLRGACPVCKAGGDRALTWTPSKKMFSCQALCEPRPGQKKLNGDLVGLVAHVRGLKQIPAAQLMLEHFMREEPKAKKPPKRAASKRKFDSSVVRQEEYTIVDWLQL